MLHRKVVRIDKLFTVLFRVGLVIIAVLMGTAVFWLLTIAGSKTKGPLDDFMASTNNDLSQFEQSVISSEDSRASRMAWFTKYRKDKSVMNATDTILLGAYDDRTDESYQPIISLEDSLQINLPIISIYAAWGSKKNQVFPFLRAQAIYDLGSIPMITWEPWLDDFDAEKFPVLVGKKFKNVGGLKAIAEGKFDVYIDTWAKTAAQFGHPFLLRFAHEMNDPYRYPWGPPNNGPEDFIAAWQYVANRFKMFGADNALWVWSPHPAYETYAQFYPGKDYVDWIGVTALNYGSVASWSRWWSFDDIFGKFHDSVSLYKKPMMLTEFSSLAVGGNRADWFSKALDSIPIKYPAVKSIIFFHVTNDNTTSYKSLDWSFENDARTSAAVKAAIHDWKKLKLIR